MAVSDSTEYFHHQSADDTIVDIDDDDKLLKTRRAERRKMKRFLVAFAFLGATGLAFMSSYYYPSTIDDLSSYSEDLRRLAITPVEQGSSSVLQEKTKKKKPTKERRGEVGKVGKTEQTPVAKKQGKKKAQEKRKGGKQRTKVDKAPKPETKKVKQGRQGREVATKVDKAPKPETKKVKQGRQGKEETKGKQQAGNNDSAGNVENNEWPPTDLLNNIADDSKRLVVAASNHDYVDFADNFAQSLIRANVTNFVLIPLDRAAHDSMSKIYPKNTLPLMPKSMHPNDPVVVKGFSTTEFQKLTSTRPQFLRAFLRKGFTIFYNDIDMVWNQNAWKVLEQKKKGKGSETATMLWHDGPGHLCSCMIYMEPTVENRYVLTRWQDEIDSKQHKNDQPAFNKVLEDIGLVKNNESQKNRVQVFKNDGQFPHGQMYFGKKDQKQGKKAIEKRKNAIIIHNNWLSGKDKKIQRFKANGLWYARKAKQ